MKILAIFLLFTVIVAYVDSSGKGSGTITETFTSCANPYIKFAEALCNLSTIGSNPFLLSSRYDQLAEIRTRIQTARAWRKKSPEADQAEAIQILNQLNILWRDVYVNRANLLNGPDRPNLQTLLDASNLDGGYNNLVEYLNMVNQEPEGKQFINFLKGLVQVNKQYDPNFKQSLGFYHSMDQGLTAIEQMAKFTLDAAKVANYINRTQLKFTVLPKPRGSR